MTPGSHSRRGLPVAGWGPGGAPGAERGRTTWRPARHRRTMAGGESQERSSVGHVGAHRDLGARGPQTVRRKFFWLFSDKCLPRCPVQGEGIHPTLEIPLVTAARLPLEVHPALCRPVASPHRAEASTGPEGPGVRSLGSGWGMPPPLPRAHSPTWRCSPWFQLRRLDRESD